MAKAQREALRRSQTETKEQVLAPHNIYAKYQTDPAGFGSDVLHSQFTPQIVRVMESVRDFPVTIARSSNAFGKCVAYGDLLHLADGQRVPAETLIGQEFRVLSVQESLSGVLVQRPLVRRAWATDNGLRPCIRIRTARGRTLTRTLNHPLAILNDDSTSLRWMAAGDLTIGVCLPARHTRSAPGWGWETDTVVALELTPPLPTVAVEVETDHTFLTEFIEHNTHSAARIAVWWYKCFPGAQVYTTAAPPEDNLRRLLWGEIGKVKAEAPAVFGGDRISQLHIARSEFEFITGVTIPMNDTKENREARFSGKHAPYLLFIVDEGDAVPAEIYKAIEGCMSGGVARLLVMFNPRSRAGPIWRMERDRAANVVELNALDHPNVVEGSEIYPGAVTRPTTVRRINEMTRPLSATEEPDSRCFEVPPYLVGETSIAKSGLPYPPLQAGWRKIEDPIFSYMVLGRYPAQGINQLISEEWIAAARTRWDAYVAVNGETPPVGVRAIFGLDVAEFGLDSNVLIGRYGGWVAPAYTWAGVDPTTSGDKVVTLLQPIYEHVAALHIDAIGVGAGIPGYLKRKITRRIQIAGIKSSERPTERPVTNDNADMGKFGTLRDQLWWAVREWLRGDTGAMLPPDEPLLEELLLATYDFDPRTRDIKIMSKDRMKELLKRSPDRADALCLTFAPTTGKFDYAFVPFTFSNQTTTRPSRPAPSPTPSSAAQKIASLSAEERKALIDRKRR